VSIPETIWNIPVKAIGNDAFRNKGITGVIIPNSVISIGLRAFGGNKLTSITIQDRVTPITFERSCGDAENISIVIGAGVTLDGDPMDHSYGGQHQKDFWKWPSKFKEYYEKNSRKAGTYTGKRVKWPQAVATSGRITYQSPGYRWSFKLR
jgi:hypothetical protein